MHGWMVYAWFEKEIRRRVIQGGSGEYAFEMDRGRENARMSPEHSNSKLLTMGSNQDAQLTKEGVHCR